MSFLEMLTAAPVTCWLQRDWIGRLNLQHMKGGGDLRHSSRANNCLTWSMSQARAAPPSIQAAPLVNNAEQEKLISHRHWLTNISVHAVSHLKVIVTKLYYTNRLLKSKPVSYSSLSCFSSAALPTGTWIIHRTSSILHKAIVFF